MKGLKEIGKTPKISFTLFGVPVYKGESGLFAEELNPNFKIIKEQASIQRMTVKRYLELAHETHLWPRNER